MTLSIIAAMDLNRGIGINQSLPWSIPDDLRHFKKITMNKTIIMGGNTYRSLPKVLEGREYRVLTKKPELIDNGIKTFGTIGLLMRSLVEKNENMVIGGGQIYNQIIPYCNKMYLTVINSKFCCDTEFPFYDNGEWKGMSYESKLHKGKDGDFHFTFIELKRISSGKSQ